VNILFEERSKVFFIVDLGECRVVKVESRLLDVEPGGKVELQFG